MPEEPWHQARESREDSRSQSLQAGAEQSGLKSAAGLLAVGVLGPMALRSGARKAISAMGRGGDDALQQVRKAAGKTDDAASLSDDAFRKAAKRTTSSPGQRLRASAARARQSKGKVDLSKFAADAGYGGFERTRRRSQRYRQFKRETREQGDNVVSAFLSKGRREQSRLARSAAEKVKHEMAVEGPALFALDYSLGVTQSPSERHAAYDVVGHAQEAAEYTPTFAAYELGSRAAMLAVPAAARTGIRAAKEFLQESDTAAKAVSKTFGAMEGAKRGAQQMSGQIQDRYRQHVRPRPSSVDTAREAAAQAKEFLREQAGRGKSAVERYMSDRTSGMARDPTAHSETLQGASELVGDPRQSQRDSPFVQQVLNAGADDDIQGLEAAVERLRVGEDAEPMDPVARALGGKAATIEDVRQSDHVTLSDEASQSLDDLQERIGEAQELIDRQSQQISNKRLQSVAQELQPENLRASGYAKIGGETMRVPTAGDMRRTIGGALDRATRMLIPGTERQGGSIFEILGGKNLQKVRPAVRPMSGGMDVEGDLMYFGKGAPAQADVAEDRGLAVMDYPGSTTGRLYGPEGGDLTGGESMFISPRTEGKMHTLRMRQHYQTDTTREESLQSRRAGDGPPSGAGASYAETMPGQMYGMLQQAKKTLSLGRHQGENTAYQRIKSTLGSASPRRLFAEDSELWSASLARETEQGATPIADAVFTTRQALRNATDTYTTPEVFGRAARESLPGDTIEKLGGTDAILKSRKKTLDAAKDLLDTMPRDEGLQAPSASEAQKIVQEATGNLDRLYNAHGRPRAQTLRRFIAEQGALGTSTGGGALGDMKGMIDDLEAEGKLNRRAAREARAGLANLDIQQEAGEQLKNPYQALSEQSGGGTSRTLQAAQDALRQNRDALEQFGQTRDRVDLSYHRKAFTEPDYFSSPFEETGSFAMEGSPMSAGRLLAESGLETTRRALSSVGMGWNPNVSLTSNEGLRSVGKIWAKRGAAVVGGAMAYRAADTGTDVALPDDMPLGEGVGMAGADIAANAAVAASNVYDSLGITGAAQYMEGLMPKSTSMLPGAAAGYYAAGMKGAVAGAAINRVTQETFTNTPLEGLAIAPPLAPFVSDMTETAEQTEAEYQGRKWVPQRKGRFFMLSGTPYSGERIESYRPNWYTRQKAQSKATPALYGSKAEAAIFKDLPLIDFAPGDILDPQYLQKTQSRDRPYVAPDTPFSEVPLAGPVLGATVGKAYNAIHPMASNRPRHLEDVVGSFQGEGVGNAPAQVGSNYPSMAAGNFAGGFQSAGQPGAQVNAPGGESAYVEGQTVVSGDSPSAVLDEQFYRLSEAMGFTGFVGQQAVGGEGIFRRPRYKSASRMDSTSRAFHDLKMGDMAGVGEAIRRLYPFERGGETAQGPRNTQADFMPQEFKCITPDTVVEVGGSELLPAKEIEVGDEIRTHKGSIDPVTAVREREMEKDETLYEVSVGNLQPFKMEVSEEHPFWTKSGWEEIEEVEEGEFVGYPVPELESLFDDQKVVDLANYAEEYENGYGNISEDVIETAPGYEIDRYVNLDTEEFGTLAGYLVAEGSATGGQIQMPITGDFGKEFADAFESVFGIRPSPQQRDYEDITRWTVSNTVLARFFREFFGFPGETKRLHLTENNWKDFLRTLMNGDGSFFKTGDEKWQSNLKQNHNPEMLYRVWQAALAHKIVGAVSDEALVFRGKQAVEFARLIGFDKAERFEVLKDEKPDTHEVDVGQYVSSTVTDQWVYNRNTKLAPLIEYIEEEKNGDPYWDKGEAKRVCGQIGVEYYSGIGAKARRAYKSLQNDSNHLYRVPRRIDVNDCEWLTSDYRHRKVPEQIVRGLRGDGLIRDRYAGNHPEGSHYWHFEDGYWWTKLSGKKELDQQQLISIQVAGDHSFCLPGVATHNSGDPYCLTSETPIEIDGEMVPAEEAYELVSEEPGEHTTRTHVNNERPIEAAAKREVDEPIIRLDVEGLDWTLKLTRGHPVLIYDQDERDTRWVLAGELEEGDTVLEPLGEPDPDEIQLELGHKKSPHFYRKKSGVLMKALHSLFKVQPPPRERFRMDGPSQREMRHINHAFGLSGTKYPQRKKQEVAWLRRQMAERGLPKGLAGIPPGVVRVLIEPWIEEVSSDDAAITLRLTPENLGREELEAWSMRKPYEPEASKAEVVRRAAHRLMRVLSEADTPGRLEFLGEETAEITLRGLHASRLIYSQYRLQNAQSGTHVRKFSGEHSIKTRSKDGNRRVLREVESVEWESYEGPVYAFQVEEDSSFVAGGIATHNSKIAMGESLLPGAGLEATGAVGYGKAALEAEDVGRTTYGTALRMLGIEGREPSDREKWAKKQAQKRFIDSGAAVRTEAVFVDEEKKVTAVADAATQGNNPIHIEALSEAKFRQTNQPRELDTMRMNAMLGAADQSKGMIAYVNQQTGEMRTFTERFDSSLYNKTVRKMQSARSLAKRYAEKGYGAKGAMYSPTDRLRVLMNADPFGKQWQVEYKKAEKLYSSGEMAPRARREFEKIVRNHDEMRLPFEMYPDRFGSAGDVLNPPEQQANLTYNENVKSAAQYSLPERAAGAVYSAATSVRTPLHTKVFGNYNMREQYENRVLLDRDYQSWAQPVDDFVKPYMQGLAAADDPMQGALSYGLGGAVFGGPAFGAVGAITGSVYGAGRGAYESATGTTYVPEEEQELRRTSQQFDRMKYHRARRLYNATGAQQYREQMQNTAVGWTRQGLDGEGWAKSRRRAYSPEERMDSPLFQGDEGFSSPYRGLSKVDDFADAVVKHDGPALSLGKGVNQMDAMDDAARSSLELVDDTSRTFARKAPAAPPAAAVRARGGPARQAPTGGRMRGLPEAGYAKALRAHQTGKAPGSGEGFASPYQGQDPEQAVRYDAEGDPTQSAIPPEMLTAFGAVPEEERDFLRAGLRTRDPDQQAAMLRMVSDDFAAMMDVGWNYLHGQDLRGEAMDTDPMRQIDRDLASHPVMGKGANVDSYKIRTLQDRGMEASDAGLGWKDQMKRLEQAVVGAQPVSATMDGAQKEAGDPQELRSMIKTVLAQMGIRASVSIEPTSSPTEIHLRQRTQS